MDPLTETLLSSVLEIMKKVNGKNLDEEKKRTTLTKRFKEKIQQTERKKVERVTVRNRQISG